MLMKLTDKFTYRDRFKNRRKGQSPCTRCFLSIKKETCHFVILSKNKLMINYMGINVQK